MKLQVRVFYLFYSDQMSFNSRMLFSLFAHLFGLVKTLDGEWGLSNIGTNQVISLPGEPIQVFSGKPLEWIVSSTDLGFRFDSTKPEQNMILEHLFHRVRHFVCPSPVSVGANHVTFPVGMPSFKDFFRNFRGKLIANQTSDRC